MRLIQASTRTWSIQPDSWAWMITPFTFTFGNLPFQDDVWRQYSAVRHDAQHYHTLLVFVTTSSYCNIFVTFLMHRCVEGHFVVHWSLVSITNLWNNVDWWYTSGNTIFSLHMHPEATGKH
jgi:hypothetical protein